MQYFLILGILLGVVCIVFGIIKTLYKKEKIKFKLNKFLYGVGSISFIVLLLGYWIVIHFLGTENPYSLETNIVRKIDLLLFGEQHLYGGYGVKFDPEGLLSSIPAIGSVLLGYFSGRIIDKSGGVFLRIRNLWATSTDFNSSKVTSDTWRFRLPTLLVVAS
jgi:hypothetical protein